MEESKGEGVLLGASNEVDINDVEMEFEKECTVDEKSKSGRLGDSDDDSDYDEKPVPIANKVTGIQEVSDSDSDDGDTEAKSDSKEGVHFVDIEALSVLVERGENDIKCLRGKDVVLVIGKTGVGKTSLIQLLNGAKVYREGDTYKFVESNFLLQNFAVGYSEVSQTKCVNTYEHKDSNFVFCDMPGFKDTCDYNIDIATAVWIKSIATVSKSVRFILMIGASTLEEEKGELLRGLLEMFSKLVNNDLNRILNSIVILFTHMSDRSKAEDPLSDSLEYIRKKLKKVYKPLKNPLADEMLAMMLTFIKENTTRVRVLNPIITDISDLSRFIGQLEPIENAQDLIQPSVSHEIETSICLVMEKLSASIRSSLHSPVPTEEHKLGELLRLYSFLATLLNDEDYIDNLRKLMTETAEEYEICKQSVLEVVDSSVGNCAQAIRLQRAEVEIAMVNFSKLRVMGLCLQEFCTDDGIFRPLSEDEESEWDVEKDISSVQIEYHTKCVVLKSFVLGQFWNTLDYTSVIVALDNLILLRDMQNTIGGQFQKASPSFPNISNQFCELLHRALDKLSTSKNKNNISAIELKVRSFIEKEIPPPLHYLLDFCLSECITEGKTCYILDHSVETPEKINDFITKVGDHLKKGEVLGKFIWLKILRRSVEDMRKYLTQHILQMYKAVTDFVCGRADSTTEDLRELCKIIRRIQSYETCTKHAAFNNDANDTNSVQFESSVTFFQKQDQSFAEYVKDQYGNLAEQLGQDEEKVTALFDGLACRLQLTRNHEFKICADMFTTACHELKAVVSDIQAQAESLVLRNNDEINEALVKKSFQDVELPLRELICARSQVEFLIPDYDAIKKIHWETLNSLRTEKNIFADDLLKRMRAPQFNMKAFEVRVDGITKYDNWATDLQNCFDDFEVIDDYGYYNQYAKYQELKLPSDSPLGPLINEIKKIVEEKITESSEFILSLDDGLSNQLVWLKNMKWFDEFCHDGREAVTNVLNIVQIGCSWRLDILNEHIKALTSYEKSYHHYAHHWLEELQSFKLLTPSRLDLGEAYDNVIRDCDNAFVMFFIKVRDIWIGEPCNQIDCIETLLSTFPFKEADEFLETVTLYEGAVKDDKDFFNELKSLFCDIESIIATKLDEFIEKPFVDTPFQLDTADLDFVVNVLKCQEKMSWFKSLNRLVTVFHNFLDGVSIIESFRRSVKELDHDLKKQMNKDTPYEILEKKLDLLKRCIPLDYWLKENISETHNLYSIQYLTLRSAVQDEMKNAIAEWNFTGVRDFLTKNKTPEIEAVYKSYKELMSLIERHLSQSIAHFRANVKDGKIMSEAQKNLEHVWLEIGGGKGEFDFVKDECNIDIEAELAVLDKSVRDYINTQMDVLDNYRNQYLEVAVRTADDLLVFNESINNEDLTKRLDTFVDGTLSSYVLWDGIHAAEEQSLASEVEFLVTSVNERQAVESGDNELSVAALTNILDQMRHMHGSLKLLDQYVDYDFWCRQIAVMFNEMLDSATKTAMNTSGFATCLALLTHVSAHFSEGFKQHFPHDVFNLKNRIDEMTAFLEDYNRTRSSWYDTIETCEMKRQTLINCKMEDERRGMRLQQYNHKRGYITHNYISRYETQVEHCKSDTDALMRDFTESFDDQNFDMVEKCLTFLRNIDEVLYVHLRVPLETVYSMISLKYQELLGKVNDALNAKDMRSLESRIAELFRFRQMVERNHLTLDRTSVEKSDEIHNNIAAMLRTVKSDFEAMCKQYDTDDSISTTEQFDFANAVQFVDLLQGTWQFIESSTTNKYCAQFGECDYITSLDYIHESRFNYKCARYTDRGLASLNAALKEFPTETEIRQRIVSLQEKMIDVVRVSADHHEYFKLKSISKGLESIHLLADIGGGKVQIDDTKSSIQQIIAGSLNALQINVNNHMRAHDWSKLNDSINLLQNAEVELKHFSGFIDSSKINSIAQDIENHLKKKADKAIASAESISGDGSANVDDFAVILADLGEVYDQVQVFHKIAKHQITRVLNYCREEVGFNFIFKLGVCLQSGEVFENQDDDESAVRIAKRLVSDFPHFKDVNVIAWNNHVSTIPVEDNLQGMEAFTYDSKTKKTTPCDFDHQRLLDMYAMYDDEYIRLRQEYLRKHDEKANIVLLAEKRVKRMPAVTLDDWDDSNKEEIPLILAAIFAYFTVSKCGESYNSIGTSEDADNKANAEKILITPHSIQVLTILRLLGCAGTTRGMKNQLMQIGTGEGKSIVLGALATIFALLDFPVRCVCYSEYLSTRDYDDFEDIFKAFKCEDKIVYSKITNFSEHSIALEGNIRQLTQAMILNKLTKSEQYLKPAPSKLPILLVDEVDVFFGKDFYGQTYNQVTHISTPEVITLIQEAWKLRTSKPSLHSLSKCSAYQALINKFPDWKYLIDNELKLMCSQVKVFDHPAYVYDPVADQIGYSEHDSINFNLSYGYRTIFAYLYELDRGNVRSEHKTSFIDKHLHLQVSCGQFSYANINPACIMGVSGTLTSLTDYEWDIMSRYDIDEYSVSPSVYGVRNMVFDRADKGIVVADTKAIYFKGIVDAINEISRTKDSARKKDRAIIVFFESLSRLNEFRTSQYFRQVIENTKVNCLTENTPKDDRNYIIGKAATMGQVTLATKAFGRGTDFISRDSGLNERDGTHILQTFLSKTLSEEVQIQGRTSRQGQKGSYGMILLMIDDHVEVSEGVMEPKADTLEYFNIRGDDITNQPRDQRYAFLCRMRDERRIEEAKEIEENIAQANERDTLTRKYFSALLSINYKAASDAFNEIYTLFKGNTSTICQLGVHVVFMLDESYSMENSFEELRTAYWDFVRQRQGKGTDDRMSVVMFKDDAYILTQMVPFSQAPELIFTGGMTAFDAPLLEAQKILNNAGDCQLMPILLLMTDGGAPTDAASKILQDIDSKYRDDKLQVHFVAFGSGADISKLEILQSHATEGFIHTSAMGELATTFESIENSLPVQGEYS